MASEKRESESTRKVFLKLSVSLDSIEQSTAVFNCSQIIYTKINDAINNKLFEAGARVPDGVIFSDETEFDYSDEEFIAPADTTPALTK